MLAKITEKYAIYHGDCIEVLASFPSASIDLSVYSPPFCGLFQYTSSERDLSNCRTREEFLAHYGFLVTEIARLTKPGRLTAVHCMDVPTGGGELYDFGGDIIRLHETAGFHFIARHAIWKPPLQVRMRTMAKGLAHRTICEDSAMADVAGADYLLLFRKRGTNAVPIEHPTGFLDYAGARQIPADILSYRGYAGDQTQNRYSHWIWRQYASSVWDDVRLDRVLPFRESREEDDEKHVHPLQLDVIERVIVMRSNPGETVLTPFMGVGSEVYGAVINGRRGIGVELKASYFKQACKNLEAAAEGVRGESQEALFVAPGENVAGEEGYFSRPDTEPKNPHTWKGKKTRREVRERLAPVETE